MIRKFLLSLTVLILVACGESKDKTVSSEVRISGSSSISPLMVKLAEGFEKENGNKYSVIVETSDSTIGIQDTIEGKNEIGMASRDIKPTELNNIETILLCQDGIALIVNKEANINDINKIALTALYMDNKSIGNVSKAIAREDSSGTRGAFADLTGIAKTIPLPATVEILDGTGKVKTSVASDKAKLGYISLGAVDDTIKVLAYNDGTQNMPVAASIDNIKNGSYKLYRPFNMVVKKGSTLSEGAKEFLSFIDSPEGQDIISKNGYITK